MIPGIVAQAAPLVGPAPTTTFLTRFNTTPPIDEVSSAAGTLVGDAYCDEANSRLVLDGVSDWCTFPSASIDDDVPASWTLECHTDAPSGSNGGFVSWGTVAAGANRLCVFRATSHIQIHIGSYSGSTALLDSGTGFLDGSEHHVAVVRDGDTWRLYRDGVQVASRVWAGAPVFTTDMYVGTDSFATTSREVSPHIGRVKLSNVCLYPGGTTFTPPARTDP